jgi:uncharacterized repeat protein (TIGR01451 family)
VVSDVYLLWGIYGSTGHPLGHQRLGSGLSIAVDPNNANTVYVAFERLVLSYGGYIPQVQVYQSTDGGLHWTHVLPTFFFDVPSALPALAVAANGTLAVLYTTYDGNLTTHLLQAIGPALTTTSHRVLAQFPDDNPVATSPNYIGDYQDIEAVGNRFYGTFSASNEADPAHFPNGVFFQRYFKIGATVHNNATLSAVGTLVSSSAGTTVVSKSIDPYFFSLAALTRRWLPPTVVIKVDPRLFQKVELIWLDCRIVDCCPGCPGDPLAPVSYPEVSSSLGPSTKWTPLTNPIKESNGQFSMTVDASDKQAFFRLVQRTPTNAFFTVTAAAGNHGSISPSGALRIQNGATQNFSATASNLYTVDKWFLDGEVAQLGGSTLSLSNVLDDHSVTVTFTLPDDLAVHKTGPAGAVAVNSNVTYTLTVANRGTRVATGVTVTDHLPLGFTFVSVVTSQGSCTVASNTVKCVLGTLKERSTAFIQIMVTPTNTGSFTNVADVVGAAPEQDLSNNSATVVTEVQVPPNISAPPRSQTASLGQTVTFRVVAEGTQPLRYSWAFNGNFIPGQTNSTLTLGSVQPDDEGEYLVLVVNAVGQIQSAPVTLRINEGLWDLKNGQVEPKRVEGGGFPPVPPDFDRFLNEEDEPFIVPIGPPRGNMTPQNNKYEARFLKPKDPAGSGDPQAPLFFREYDEIDDATPSAHTLFPEPSVAENGQTVMTTGNFWMSLSLDGGQNFTSVNPTTIFPQDYGGFCCDQVLTYVPRYDLFVWLLQYSSSAGRNAIRIAVQSTSAVRSSNGTSWTYWDFTNDIFAPSGALDYNDMSFGDNFLYWTSSVGGGANRYVIRVPLQELSARSTVHFQFTGSTSAYWSHVTQNGHTGVYWAGHVDNSTLRVYSMMDADGFYSWRSVAVNSWPNSTISSIAANGTDWLLDGSWKTYIRAAAVQDSSAYFAWNASSGGGFPQAHVQIVRINTTTWTLQSQMQIWNPDFAFAYPYFAMNAEGQLGMISAFGGGPYNASSGVGVWGDFVIYYPRLSNLSQNAYGHYHTVRRSGADAMQWVAAGYTHQADGSVLPYYVRFSR